MLSFWSISLETKARYFLPKLSAQQSSSCQANLNHPTRKLPLPLRSPIIKFRSLSLISPLSSVFFCCLQEIEEGLQHSYPREEEVSKPTCCRRSHQRWQLRRLSPPQRHGEAPTLPWRYYSHQGFPFFFLILNSD